MSTMPVYPPGLPTSLLLASYQEMAPSLLLRTDMDAGPAKQRRRFTAGVRVVSGKEYLRIDSTGDQRAAFENFFYATLQGGALAFQWTTKNGTGTSQALIYRFTKPPTYKPMGGGIFEASLELEIMP